MTTDSDGISSELSSLLTHLAEELYWGDEEYPDDVSPVRERAENYGLDSLLQSQD